MPSRYFFPAVALSVLVAAFSVRAQDFSQVEITRVPVAEGIDMLMGAGGNIGVSSGEDGIFLIDDQYAPLTEKILAAVGEIHDGPVRFVLNTHWHGDHTGGNENLGKAGVLIVAHDNVRERMSVDQFMAAFDRTVPAAPKEALPVVTFNDAVTFHLNGQTIWAHHVQPAHTDGDSVVVFRGANVVHMGDTFFNERFPFIDVASGGSISGMIEVTARVLENVDDETRIIPGHGPLGNKADLRAFHDALAATRDAVQAALAEGKTADALVAEDPIAALTEGWAGDRAGFLRRAYADLARDTNDADD